MGLHTKISRHDFLKNAGLLAAGATVMPDAFLSAMEGAQAGVTISRANLASYSIVVPDDATATDQHAVEELQHYLAQSSQVTLTVKKEAEHRSGPAFFVGLTHRAKDLHVDFKALGQDGFAFYPAGKSLIVAGGTGKGTLYGVYGLLEFWGFRMYTSAAIQMPKTAALRLPAKAVVVPQITYRTTSYRDTRDAKYTDWHRLNSRDDWGLFVHTFNELVPPDQYGTTHPEYFSLVNGKRLPGTQLCLSNGEVLALVIANLKTKIAAKPNATYWSVSQNDNDQYCRCGPCGELNTKYGGVPSGSILYFVNDVAKAFPDKIISTLAYWYSRTPPANITAQPNVNIMLCNIESKRQAPVFDTDPAFTRDLVSWSKLAQSILIWDYNIQFANLVSPFPNLHTIKPNIKFYTDHQVNSLYMQANGQAGGEMAGLRAYLICKLMWNPDADDSAIIDEYLNGYYGAAAPYIRQYIDTMRASLVSTKFQLNIFGSPEDAKDTYLSADMMKVYNAQIDQAQKAVAKSPDLVGRVKIARLPMMYAQIQIGRNEVDTPRSMFAHSADGKVYVKPEMKELVSAFVSGCTADGVTRVRERSTPPEDYGASYDRIFNNMAAAEHAKSLGKIITATTLPETGAAGLQQLTDGIFGSYESWSAPDVHWVAYKGKHMDFMLDLGEVKDIQSVQMDFLNAQAQADWNVLVLPTYVSYAFSVDGTTYSDEIKVVNPIKPNPRQNPDVVKIPFQAFRADLHTKARARFVRAHAESLLHMPAWHIRAGSAAVLCTDQIVVT
jgi:hypothetical protein